MGFPTPKLKKVRIAQRKEKVITMMRQHPDFTQQDIADQLGVNRSTIAKDLKEINEELNMQTIEDWMVQRQRILIEIQENKKLCMDKLKKLHHSPHQGARWMEEWSKLAEKEIRIYGVYSPEKMMIKHSQEFSKEQKDAAVDAAIGATKDGGKIINLTQKQLTDGSEKDDDVHTEPDPSVITIA
jgi:transcriptional antiterminator